MADVRIWISSNSDKLLLAGFGLIFLLVGLQRLDYSGDGLRHLGSILRSDQPSLGEPRWILFPLLLFAIVKPFVVFSAGYSISEAARVFVLFNVVCGCVYLLCLRRWISELRANQRFAVLLLAGGSSTFLALATDTIEPTAAVTIAIIGVTFARFKEGLSDGVRLIIATLAIALASLLYQGLLLGLFFLPAIFPLTILISGRNGFRIIFLGLAGPLATIILLSLYGESPRNAVRRFLQGEANQLSSQQYSAVSPKNLVGVVIVGPTYALASIPERRGLKGSIRLLGHLDTALEGITGAAAWLCTAMAIVAAIVILAHKREFAVLFALAGMMLLPMIRMSQYSYLKFYVLLPFLVVLVVPRLKVKFIYPGILGALILVSNLGHLWVARTEFESLRLQVAHDLYPRLPEGTCFLSNGWGVPVPDWRGDNVAWQHILNGGHSTSYDEIARANSRLLRYHLRKLFCTCPALVTDAFISRNLASLQQELSYFRIEDIPLSELIVSTSDAAEVFRSPKFTVYLFPYKEQQRACDSLKEQ